MAKYFFCAFVVVFLASWTKKKCNYNRKIEFISVREWRNAYCPYKGKIYVYKKDEGLTHPVDSTGVFKFEISTSPTIYESGTANLKQGIITPERFKSTFYGYIVCHDILNKTNEQVQ